MTSKRRGSPRPTAKTANGQGSITSFVARSKQAAIKSVGKDLGAAVAAKQAAALVGEAVVRDEGLPPSGGAAVADEGRPPKLVKSKQDEDVSASGDITAKINELKASVEQADVSLSTWLSKHPAEIVAPEVESEEDEADGEPPALDVLAPTIKGKYVPPLQSQQAVLIASRLRLPTNILSLAVPLSISFLESVFGHLEHVLVLAASRSQPAVFHKLLRPLENILGRRVTMEHLDQIRALWPDAYTFDPCRVIHDGRRVESIRLQRPDGSELERKVMFRWKVIEFIQKRHAAFLKSSLALESVPEVSELKSWHPGFALDALQIIERAEEPAAEAAKAEDVAEKENAKPAMSLIDRIRARQQQTELGKILAAPKEQASRAAFFSELVEKIVIVYAQCRKGSLLQQELLERLKGATAKDISDLAALAPGWMSIVHADEDAGSGPLVVRIDRTMPARAVKALLQ